MPCAHGQGLFLTILLHFLRPWRSAQELPIDIILKLKAFLQYCHAEKIEDRPRFSFK